MHRALPVVASLALAGVSVLLSPAAFAETTPTLKVDVQRTATVEAEPIEIDLETAMRRGDVQRFPVEESSIFGESRQRPSIEKALDGKDDPPALLEEAELGSLKDLALRLSVDRSWLRPEILQGLALQDLRLDEVFVDAPELLRVKGELYRLQIERIGPMWEGFDAERDPYVVFISQEVFDGWGSDRAMAFRDGLETFVLESDVEEVAALAVTLADLLPGEVLYGGEKISSPLASIELGAAELRLPVERLPRELLPSLPGVDLEKMIEAYGSMGSVTAASTCQQEIASTACSSGKPVCPAGYSPYFVLEQVLIKTDHEGVLKGNPEIELFPLRIDVASVLGSNTTASTNLWFYGQSVTDMAGRTRFLPDVNNTNVWYTVTNGLAIVPTDLGKEFSALLVEQDDDRGVLRVHPTRVNVTKLWKSVSSIVQDFRQIDLTFLYKVGKLIIDIIGIFNDGDDLYQESIGVANNLFCTDSLGQMKSYTFNAQEWQMKGHFSCINPACPDPGTGGGGGGGGGLPGCFVVNGLMACP